MREAIDYLKQHFNAHPKIKITIRILELLDYIAKNRTTVLNEYGKSNLFRHPDNHLAIHIRQYADVEALDQYLRDIIEEAGGCFQALIAEHRQNKDSVALHYFLLNINDSDVGCMEARLRGALNFVGLYQSSGNCLRLDSLMEEFNGINPSIENILDHFGEKVDHLFPVLSPKGQIEPLSWKLIIEYFSEVFLEKSLEQDWLEFRKNNPPLCIERPGQQHVWMDFYFADAKEAKIYLSYIKSILPEYKEALAKITIKSIENQHSFSLTQQQYQSFNEYLGLNTTKDKPPKKVGKKVKNDRIAPSPLQKADDFVEVFKPAYIVRTGGAYLLIFISPTDAQKCQQMINTLLKTSIGLLDARSFHLTSEQLTLLRTQLRNKSAKINQSAPFFMKSLRADNKNFYYPFVEELVDGTKFPKRKGEKRAFTVTGNGVFARKAQYSEKIPLKIAQYTKAEKQGFSNFQSTSLVLPELLPRPFGFAHRNNAILTFNFAEKDVLLSERLYIYDGATVKRPYDHDDAKSAQSYYKQKQNVLFSNRHINDFKAAILSGQNKDKYNEALVRLRWNADGSSFISINSDNLEMRLLAKQYADTLATKLKQANQCPEDYEVPLCFYTPEHPDLLLKRYSKEEQVLDYFEALTIYLDPTLKTQKYQANRFEFLLALPIEILKNAVLELYGDTQQSIAFYIINRGYLHLFRFLQERLKLSFDELLDADLQKITDAEAIPALLYAALAARYFDLAEYFYQKIKDSPLKNKSPNLNNGLLFAYENNLAEWLEKLIALDRLDIDNISDEQGFPLMVSAAKNRQIEVVRTLLKGGANVDSIYTNGSTPLMFAAQNSHDNIVQLLLNNKANINAGNKDGYTALMFAIKDGQYAIVKMLLEQGANPDLQNNNGQTALMYAAVRGKTDVVKMLLERGANPDLQDNYGQTALMHAAVWGKTDVVKMLLERGANPDLQDNYGNTALMLTVAKGKTDVVKMLLERGANPDLQDNYGNTALMLTVAKGKTDVVKMLLERGANPDLRNNNGQTALMYAAKLGKVELVKKLLDKGANLELQSDLGQTAYKIADKHKFYNIVEELNKTKKYNELNQHAQSISSHFNFSCASKIANLFYAYAHPPLFSFTWRHYQDLADQIANHLRQNPNMDYDGCIRYIRN